MAKIDSLTDVNILNVFQETAVDPASVAANTVAEQAFTVTGVGASDRVISVKPPASLGLVVGAAWVSAADEVTVQLANPTASPVDPGAGTWEFVVAASD